MLPDPDAERAQSEQDLIAQWGDYIGCPFPSEYSEKFELQQRISLHFSGEENARAGRYPEFAEHRADNAQRLFELLRTMDLRKARLIVSVDYLECRLLRLLGKFDEARQLCQSMPVYLWDYSMLQEYIWATKRDPVPYERSKIFEDEADREMVRRFVESAKKTHEEDLRKWEARREQETQPPPATKVQTLLYVLTMGIPYVAAAMMWDTVGLFGAVAIFFVGVFLMLLVISPFASHIKTQRERLQEWESLNMRPICRISDKPDIIYSVPRR
jgi:hypothetical protein